MANIKRFNEFNSINEGNDYQEIFNTLEVMVNSDGTIPNSDIEDVMRDYDITEDEMANILNDVYSKYNKSISDDKLMELESISDISYESSVIMGDSSYDGFLRELKKDLEDSVLEYNTEEDIIEKSKDLYNKAKENHEDPNSLDTISITFDEEFKKIVNFNSKKSIEEIANLFMKNSFIIYRKEVVMKKIEEVLNSK